MNEYLAIPGLQVIDTRREEGDTVAPPMRRDFDIVGMPTLHPPEFPEEPEPPPE